MLECEIRFPWTLLEELERLNPEAVLFEPRELYDKAVIGITRTPVDGWERDGTSWVVVYDYDALVACTQDGMENTDVAECMEEALDWVDYNMVGLWAGDGTPAILSFHEEDECDCDEDEDADYAD